MLAISNEMGYIVNYEYDYSGTRVKKMYSAGNSYKYINAYFQKRSDGLTMKHIFDGMSRIVTEQLDAGGTSRFWYYNNYVGSSVQITGSDGTVAQKNDFTPFGETAVSVTSSDTNFSDVTNIQYRYTGQEFDPETGFYNYNARLYDPVGRKPKCRAATWMLHSRSTEIGRFLSADSIVPDPFDAQDFNRYSYVLNNPIRYNDPTGHDNQDPDGYEKIPPADKYGMPDIAPYQPDVPQPTPPPPAPPAPPSPPLPPGPPKPPTPSPKDNKPVINKVIDGVKGGAREHQRVHKQIRKSFSELRRGHPFGLAHGIEAAFGVAGVATAFAYAGAACILSTEVTGIAGIVAGAGLLLTSAELGYTALNMTLGLAGVE